jgi:hypothetical protein
MMRLLPSSVSPHAVAASVAQAFVAGLAVDAASRAAGHAAELAGAGRHCPAGLDMFSYYLGRAEARRYGRKAVPATGASA